MASRSQQSTNVELLEPEIAKPQPLRIIKRSQTITCNTAPRDILGLARGPSGISDLSDGVGSPPFGADRPLTVHKTRKGRGSVLDGSFEERSVEMNGSNPITDLIKKNHQRNALQDDPDLTPKAPVSRTASAGAFLKSELYRGSSESSQYDSVRLHRDSKNPLGELHSSQLNVRDSASANSLKIPERRLSKSKTFFFKAIGSRNNQEPKRIRKVDSIESNKGTLLRRLSRTGRSSTSHSLCTGRTSSTRTTNSIETDSQDIADVSVNFRESSFDYGNAGINHSTPATPLCVLSPDIAITPELSTVDEGVCTMWVAVEITGVLRAEGARVNISEDLRQYGSLNHMQIEIVAGENCRVLEVTDNLREPKTIRAGQTYLVLIKVRLGSIIVPAKATRGSSTSDELIADLENHLDGTVAYYLTIRLSYRHSHIRHENQTDFSTEYGIAAHTTTMITEAKSYIKRHNLNSAWSPRTSRALNGESIEPKALTNIIQSHLPADQAREVLRKISDDRFQARKLYGRSSRNPSSSEETVKARTRTVSNIVAKIDPITVHPLEEQSETTDPARKIWTEMRRTSRGRHHRSSISAGTYPRADCADVPRTISSNDAIDNERMRIKETALRNKRSVGADTLRSIAPSVSTVKGGGKGTLGAGLGLALGNGRSWGWGGSWW